MKNHQSFLEMKRQKKKITMLTCYDFNAAKLLSDAPIDMLLVGDSVAMVQHGFSSTLAADMPMMVMHTAAVARGAPNSFIVGDMPFLSFRKGVADTLENAGQLMRAGASAIKLEGVSGHEESIFALVESGIPVMGHLGLTPQSLHTLGGHKVQGREDAAAEKILRDSLRLEELGAFALVLECVPKSVAAKIAQKLQIPVIGIGAGSEVDGQVLVLNDMLGMNPWFKPRFLRRYADLDQSWMKAVAQFARDVNDGSFPKDEESYL